MNRARGQLNVLQLIIVPVIREFLLGPRFLNDLEPLFELGVAGLAGDTKAGKLVDPVALAYAKIKRPFDRISTVAASSATRSAF